MTNGKWKLLSPHKTIRILLAKTEYSNAPRGIEWIRGGWGLACRRSRNRSLDVLAQNSPRSLLSTRSKLSPAL